MMRAFKLVVLLLTLSLSYTAFAASKALEGFYFGGYISAVHPKVKVIFTPTGGTATTYKLGDNATHKSNNYNFGFGLLEGYAVIADDNFYLGGEITEDLSSTSNNSSLKATTTVNLETLGNTTVTWQDQQREFMSVSIMPGFFLTDNFLLFGRAGISLIQSDFRETIGTTSSSSNPLYERTKNSYSAKFGAGIAYAATSNLIVRLEYMMQRYPEFNFTHPSTSLDPTTGGVFKIKQSQNDIIALSFQYIFGSAIEQEI